MNSYISAEMKQAVLARAHGCCEYCLIHYEDAFFAHEVDHIVSVKHRGRAELINLAFCCFHCNRHKGTDIASIDLETGDIVQFFNPRTMRWDDHFQLNGVVIEPKTAIGRVTEFILQFNTPDRIKNRQLYSSAGTYPCISA
jgi:hypothetical protein